MTFASFWSKIKIDAVIRGGFVIFAETHKLLAYELCRDISRVYHIELNEKKLAWGAVAPDYLPKYKLIRHYKDESIQYICREIVRIIYTMRFFDLSLGMDMLTTGMISQRLGIISHYLADYVTLPHRERWTFKDSMIRHVKYEKRLNEYAHSHSFNSHVIEVEDMDFTDDTVVNLYSMVYDYIERVLRNYDEKKGYENDLDFALALNRKLLYFIVDTVKVYCRQTIEGRSFIFNL